MKMSIESELINRRKRLCYRANHRGIKEMDIILGQFADQNLHRFEDKELDQFEHIMENDDQELLSWFTTKISTPNHINTAMFRQILIFSKNYFSQGNSDS